MTIFVIYFLSIISYSTLAFIVLILFIDAPKLHSNSLTPCLLSKSYSKSSRNMCLKLVKTILTGTFLCFIAAIVVPKSLFSLVAVSFSVVVDLVLPFSILLSIQFVYFFLFTFQVSINFFLPDHSLMFCCTQK